MRTTPLYLVIILPLLVAAALALSEQEPNDEPLTPEGDPNPLYQGDLGDFSDIAMIVTGTIASYGPVGTPRDIDYYRFTLAAEKRLSVTLDGFEGEPRLVLFDEALDGLPTTVPLVKGDGVRWYPLQTLPTGTYHYGLAGTEGPTDDGYTFSIRPGADGVITIARAKVKLNPKKLDRDSAKIVANLGAVPPDPLKNGLYLKLLDREWAYSPAAFIEKKGKIIHKGPKGAAVRKILVNLTKSTITVVVKKTDLGAPGAVTEIDLTLEAGGTRFADTVAEPIIKKDGRLLKYKAPK